jgi:hypothetical protein
MRTRPTRGSGTTSSQIKNAPQNAYFVWRNSHLSYPRQLAVEHGRTDLTIITIGGVRRSMIPLISDIVVDHSVFDGSIKLSDDFYDVLRSIRYRKQRYAKQSPTHRHAYGKPSLRRTIQDFLVLWFLAVFLRRLDARCQFSNRFFDMHDYPIRMGGDGTPSSFHSYTCWNCGKRFGI